MLAEAVECILGGEDLSAEVMSGAMDAILSGRAGEAEIAAFVVALRMKGETPEEIAAAAESLRRHCIRIEPKVQGALLDTCGTGGDGLHTFNVSTAAAIVVAAAGVSVAKHGNRAVSSKAGSADVLEALGLRIDLDPERVRRCIEEVGIGFLFAPTHHAAMRHAAPVRRQLRVRTIFNLIGPLSNPAGATHQLVGVYDRALVEPLAQALGVLGLQAAWVVHAEGGMDEVSPAGVTTVAKLERGKVRLAEMTPEDFGLERVATSALAGGDATLNADIIRRVLNGEKGAPRHAVVINAAASLCVVGVAGSPKQATDMALAAVDGGAAKRKLEQWVRFTQSQ